MTIVRPFKGLRPRPDLAKEVASPPYDVLTTEEAREMAKTNPRSFLRVNKAELEFEPGTDQYSEAVYQRGKDNLMKMYSDGTMIRDEKPSFYLYRLTMNGKSQTGLVALTSCEEYDQNKIKKHEHTRPAKVKDRASHIEFLDAQVGPVFTTFKHDDRIDGIFKSITKVPPEVDFVADDGVRHELWVIGDKAVTDEIIQAFAALDAVYIADGHHRSASASEVRRRRMDANPNHTGNELYNYFLNVIFPDRELNILAYNRVVKDLGGMSIEEVLSKASGSFEITPHEGEINPTDPHTFGVYCDGKWYLMKSKPGSFDKNSPTGSIDAAILGENFLAPILGIDNPKTDPRIDFVGGIRGTRELVKLVDSGEYQVAFSLYPTSIRQLLDVADAGDVMPPKSTWFEPKLRSGMVVNLLKD